MAWKVKGSGTAEFRGEHSCRVEFQVENTATGQIKRERKTFQVNAHTKKEKERCKREFRAELETGIDRDLRTTTFGEYAERWLKQRQADPEIAPQTANTDGNHIRIINLTFGNVRIASITRMDVKEFQLALMTPNEETGKAATLSGKPAGGTYAGNIRQTFKQILQEAVRDGIIAVNPCDDVKAPSRDTAEKKPLTPQQVSRLKSLLDSEELTPLLVAVRLALFAGLRRAEICALRWQDLDAKAGTITVRQAICNKTLKFKETKTKAGARTIPLDDDTLEYLVKFRASRLKLLLACGKSVEDACITAEPDEEFMKPDTATARITHFCRGNGYDVTPHSLRHTYCTLLFAAGVDLKTVQYLMGHDDAKTTLRVYTHYLKDTGMKAAGAITKLMESIPETNIVTIQTAKAQPVDSGQEASIAAAAETGTPDQAQPIPTDRTEEKAAPKPTQPKAPKPEKKARPETPSLATLKKAV